MKNIFLVSTAVALVGCASIKDIDLSNAEPGCAQQCSHTYSSCVSRFTFFPIQVQHQCTDAYKLCIQSCNVAGGGKAQSNSQLVALEAQCEQEFASDSLLDPIRPYIPELASQATIAQRANNRKPNALEKKSLEAFDTWSSSCRERFLGFMKSTGAPKGVVDLYNVNIDSQRDALSELWAGKLTYGQFASKRIAINKIYDEKVTAYLAELQKANDARAESRARIAVAQQEADARADSANAQVALQTMYLINQRQAQQPRTVVVQPVQPVNPAGTPSNPIQTNCSKLGDSVNCRTYSY